MIVFIIIIIIIINMYITQVIQLMAASWDFQ